MDTSGHNPFVDQSNCDACSVQRFSLIYPMMLIYAQLLHLVSHVAPVAAAVWECLVAMTMEQPYHGCVSWR